jgi:hypothetical protein
MSLTRFLDIFPEVSLPVTLTDEAARVFSQENGLIGQGLLEQFVLPFEEETPDEFTEFVPCFLVPRTGDFHALVYWRASLMNYQFVLLTLDKNGHFIDRKTLAGTFSRENELWQSVATIDEDWQILVVSGRQSDGEWYDASASTKNSMELLPEGHIVFQS